jgi:lipopolysaccharide export LptBFGC system permease protein LptF
MNTKFNKWFEQAAADPARRRAAIADFTRQRAILFSCAVVMTICALAMCLIPTRSPGTPTLAGFGAVMMWFIVFRVDSHRRVLTLLDRFSKDRDEKPTV